MPEDIKKTEPKSDEPKVTITTDAKGDAGTPQRKRKKRSDAGKPRGRYVKPLSMEENFIPIKAVAVGFGKGLAIGMNDERWIMIDNEPDNIEKGINKYLQLSHPDLLDKAPITHAIMPVAAYLMRVVMSAPKKPKSDTTPRTIPEPAPKRTETLAEVIEKKNREKSKGIKVNSVAELRSLKLEGLDESRNADAGTFQKPKDAKK